MAYKFELHPGGELRIRARKQKQYFFGGLILVCILYAIGSYQDPNFFGTYSTLLVLLIPLCAALGFHGAFCESYAEAFAESSKDEVSTKYRRWYLFALIVGITLPCAASIASFAISTQPAYMLGIVAALYFVIRNHRLYKSLAK